MVKRIFSICFAIILVFTLCACGEDSGNLGGISTDGASDDVFPYLGKWFLVGTDVTVVFQGKGAGLWSGRNMTYAYDESAGAVTVTTSTNEYIFTPAERYGVTCLTFNSYTLVREADFDTYQTAYAEEQMQEALEKLGLQDTPRIELGQEYSPIPGITFTIHKMWVEAAEPNDMNRQSDIFVEYTVTNNTGEYVMFTISGWCYFFRPQSGGSLWGMDEVPLENGVSETRQAVLYNIDPDPEHIRETAEHGFISIHTSVTDVQSSYWMSAESLAGNP